MQKSSTSPVNQPPKTEYISGTIECMPKDSTILRSHTLEIVNLSGTRKLAEYKPANYDYSVANTSSAESIPLNLEKAKLQLYSCYQNGAVLHRNKRGTFKCSYILENYSNVRKLLNRVEHGDILYEIILKICRILPEIQFTSQIEVEMDKSSGTPFKFSPGEASTSTPKDERIQVGNGGTDEFGGLHYGGTGRSCSANFSGA